jgi:hypothetical protein
MKLEKGVIGYALYLEFRSTKTSIPATMQIITTPPFIDPSSNVYVGPVFFARSISSEKPRTQWRKNPIRDTDTLDNGGSILQAGSVADAVALNSEMFGRINGQIQSMQKMGYTLMGEPLMVEIAEREGVSIRDRDTPDGLFRRVMSARKDSGYPEDVYDGETI